MLRYAAFAALLLVSALVCEPVAAAEESALGSIQATTNWAQAVEAGAHRSLLKKGGYYVHYEKEKKKEPPPPPKCTCECEYEEEEEEEEEEEKKYVYAKKGRKLAAAGERSLQGYKGKHDYYIVEKKKEKKEPPPPPKCTCECEYEEDEEEEEDKEEKKIIYAKKG